MTVTRAVGLSVTTGLVGVLSACSSAETLPEFSEWTKTADEERVPAERPGSCFAPGDVVAAFEADELSWILGAKILVDGRVVAADGLRHSLLFFADGTPPRSVGRQGSGPGEFENLRGLFLSGDTILAWDLRARRITALSDDGDLLWTRTLDVSYDEWTGSFRGRMGSGYYPLIATASPAAGVEGSFRDVTVILIATPGGEVVPGPGFPSAYRFSAREGRGWRTHEQIFSPDIFMTVAGDVAWIGDSSSGEIASMGPTGEAIRVLRLDVTRRRATADMVEAERRAIASTGGGTALERIANEIPAREALPVFEALRGSSDGRLIVVEYAAETDEVSRTWIIDPETVTSQCILMAAGSRALDARADLVLIATRDEMGVPELELRSIPGGA